MERKETVELSGDLLDMICNELSYLPYRQVQDVFVRLGDELSEKEEQPLIMTSH